MRYRFIRRLLSAILALVVVAGVTRGQTQDQALTALPNCKLIPTPWGDGDSFLVETADGTRHTVRLYGVDCLEWHVNDETDARRLRAQRRYFGISETGGSPAASIALAKEFGRQAANEVHTALDRPFAVHTAFADAMGDGRHRRIYAFVTTAGGEDLAALLVRKGLARAFGVCRTTPSGTRGADYRGYLQDVELQAAKRGSGIWARTDWERLPNERQAERQEGSELSLAVATNKLKPGEKLDPNTAARDDLMRLPGIGETLANRIIEARPFAKTGDLLRVEGLGPTKLQQIRQFLEFRTDQP